MHSAQMWPLFHPLFPLCSRHVCPPYAPYGPNYACLSCMCPSCAPHACPNQLIPQDRDHHQSNFQSKSRTSGGKAAGTRGRASVAYIKALGFLLDRCLCFIHTFIHTMNALRECRRIESPGTQLDLPEAGPQVSTEVPGVEE